MATDSGAPEPLGAFLRRTRAAALETLTSLKSGADSGTNLTLIMGNEAGDLDSLSSSIALAYMLTHLPFSAGRQQEADRKTVYVPLIQTAASDLYLRPENEAICRFAGIDAHPTPLLTIDALEGGKGSVPDALGMDLASDERLAHPRVSFGLVDHPSLIPRWGPHERRKVRFIVDHHKDEHAHPDADFRFLRGPGSVPEGQFPIGSASSLVVELFQDVLIKAAKTSSKPSPLPKSVADLLISAIVIDTDNLRPVPRGRATPRDVLSHAILLPLSSFGPGLSAESALAGQPDGTSSGSADASDSNPSSGMGGYKNTTGNPSQGAGQQPGSNGNGAQYGASERKGAHEPCDGELPIFVMCEDVEMDLGCDNCKSEYCASETSTADPCCRATGPCDMEEDEGMGGASKAEEEVEAEAEADLFDELEAGRDLYKVLGLKRGVDQAAIRTAYRREALKCHPDRARSLRDADRRTKRFKLLVNAYEILSDPIKRRQWDMFHDPLTSGVQSGASTSYASSYSSSYTSSSFFETYGSSFSSSSCFSTSPPPNAGKGSWKFESYEQLKAEELARTQTQFVSPSLFEKPTPNNASSTTSSARQSKPTLILTQPPAPVAKLVVEQPDPEPPTPKGPPKAFTFVWESPAESLRRARARPGGPGSSSSTPGAPAARLQTGGMTLLR
ncbi:Exopolyphosphatase [Tilletia horrida]|nr:Exopolyphosphatase [Tilletia horrida]